MNNLKLGLVFLALCQVTAVFAVTPAQQACINSCNNYPSPDLVAICKVACLGGGGSGGSGVGGQKSCDTIMDCPASKPNCPSSGPDKNWCTP